MGTRPREARSNSTKICLACCSSASCATVRWGTTLEYLPPKGGVSGQQSQTALVSRRNGSSGSGTKYNTPPGKRRILAREKSNAQKPAKHWLSFSIVEPSISWGDLNGYSKVMCAGHICREKNGLMPLLAAPGQPIPIQAATWCRNPGSTSRCSSGDKQDLADVAARFHQAMRLRGLGQRELLVGERAQFARRPKWPDFLP